MDYSNNNNDKKDKERWDIIFKSVFCNIVILRDIYYYVKKYKKNEYVVFEDLQSLKSYKERDFISTIEYRGGRNLVTGDLPVNGVLKEIKFTKYTSFNGDIIPYGVELIEYSSNGNNNEYTTPFKTLPSTINTLINVNVIPINSNKDNSIYNQYSIPPNITSISFIKFPNITTCFNYNGSISIPSTIKHLKFDDDWNNQGIPLCQGDIPEGVISLTMNGYKQIDQLYQSIDMILPSTIKYLEIKLYGKHHAHFTYDFVPPNVETLVLHKNGFGITNGTNECSSIENLTIDYDSKSAIVKTNSIPPHVTNLSLINLFKINKDSLSNISNITNLKLLFSEPNDVKNDIPNGTIPNTVTHLTTNKIITLNGILPSSLSNLELVKCTTIYQPYYSTSNVGKMVKIIDDNKVTVKLPKEFHYPYLVKLFKNKKQSK